MTPLVTIRASAIAPALLHVDMSTFGMGFSGRTGAHRRSKWISMVLSLGLIIGGPAAGRAAVEDYDAVILADQSQGYTPVAKMSAPVVLTGSNRGSFDFGNTSGSVTMEFILQGDPVGGGDDAYLAVGANSSSNLRYEQWFNTGQLGFTQLGVADYLFSPTIPSPTIPVHMAYVWNAATSTMKLYLNGSEAGSRTGVSSSFAMPAGPGWLGANPNSTETMVGTIYRVTVYNSILPEELLQRHADAFNGVVRLPIIASFLASPDIIFTPNASTLQWSVLNADTVALNGSPVSPESSLLVTPALTTAYHLVAANAGGSVTSSVSVTVNPAPIIDAFAADRTFVPAGANVALTWSTRFADVIRLDPGPGDVSPLTTNGAGSTSWTVSNPSTLMLSAGNAFGTNTESLFLEITEPAGHVVISEFMADDASTWADEDGEYSGWIEIYNPSANAVDLAGYYLTDDADNPTQWAFPELVLGADAYVVVFASGKDRRDAAQPLHANFALRNGGEYLALVGPGPVLVHGFTPEYPAQRTDISYGILGGDARFVQYFGVPTPGAANVQNEPPPAPVIVEPASGVFTNSIEVTLSVADPEAQIRYTLDGSEPDATNGFLYTVPVVLSSTAHLRAAAVIDGQISEMAGGQYLKVGDDLAAYESTLPLLVIDNFGAGAIPQKGWSGTGAGIRQLPRQNALWATFTQTEGISHLRQPPQMISRIGIRGRGAFSTSWRQKPYSVEALDEAGGERDVSPFGLPKHSDWVLYFPDPDDNKDPTLLFNTFVYELSRNTGRYSVRFRWVELFLNEDGGDLSLADRRGVYALIEKVSRGNDRLDFARLSEDGSSGGWLLNLNRMDAEPENGWPAENGTIRPSFFHTAGPNRIQETPPDTPSQGDDIPRQSNGYLNFDNPNGYRINGAQRAAIEDWFREFEDVLYNDAVWRHPEFGYRQYLDPLDFADYFILNVLTRNGDGLLISMFPWKGDDGRLRMGPAWDYNWSAYYISGGPTGSLLHRSDRLWYPRLFSDPDFMQLYIDRWWELRAGPLANDAMDAVIDGQATAISPAKALLNGLPSAETWDARLSQMKTWLRDRADWIDGNYLRPPIFNQNGGIVPDGFQVVIFGTGGTIYYTTDGTDPRAPGGNTAVAAQAYEVPIIVNATTMVRARIRNGSSWSGPIQATFFPPQNLTGLTLTEIMYRPAATDDWVDEELEFLELKNTGSTTLHLGNLRFTEGIDFTFPPGQQLAPGSFVVLARHAQAFPSQYPSVAVDGIYGGRLNNGGETIRLSTPAGGTVWSVSYGDRPPWPIAADGFGFSLVPRENSNAPNSDDGWHWRASTFLGGSPGADDPLSAIGGVVINEILTHTDPPDVDAVELFNPTANSVDIGGWFLSDEPEYPWKYRIPTGTILAGGGYAVFTEDQFNPTPGTLLNFALDSAGDSIYLSAADEEGQLTGYTYGVEFGAAATGVSFGRHVISTGEEQFPPQIATTFALPNAGPLIGPVVVQEIMYHPEPGGDEFVELRNITDQSVALHDPLSPTNVWRLNGYGFTFPDATVMEPQGVLLITSGDPAVFRNKYQIPASIPVLGPTSGLLQDSGERLSLQRPDTLGTNGLSYITVDEVRYNDKWPWPPAADGGGASLQRFQPASYGNEPAHWIAAIPTPGRDASEGIGPMIVLHPQNLTVVAYQPATFVVSATGSNLRYQWLFNNSPLPGATNDTLYLATVSPEQAGEYRAVIYNESGAATSDSAQLLALLPAVILTQPQNMTVLRGESAGFSVEAFGAGTLRYQWRFQDLDIPDATNSVLDLVDIQLRDAGTYRVVITDDVGAVTSEPAVLAVLERPAVLLPPLSQTNYVGGSVTFSVACEGTLPITYRWRKGANALPPRTLHRHVDFLTIPSLQAGDAGVYFVVLSNITSTSSGSFSPFASLTVLAAADADGDGLPDPYEDEYELNKLDPTDADEDADGDGATNKDEYEAGTDPQDPGDYLKLAIENDQGAVHLRFQAVAGKTYLIQHRPAADAGEWLDGSGIAAASQNRTVEIPEELPAFSAGRFYRLITPGSSPGE